MYFAVILLVLVAVQLWGDRAAFYPDECFDKWQDRVARSLNLQSSSILHVVTCIGVPLLLVFLLDWLFEKTIWGLPTFILHSVVLFYGIGRSDLELDITEYLVSSREGDTERAAKLADQIVNTGRPVDEQVHSPDRKTVRDAIFYRAFERLFAVVFWYLLLGPVGVVAYRLLFMYLGRSLVQTEGEQEVIADRERIQTVLEYMEWPASRLLGLGFALIGDFGRTIAVWRDNLNAEISSAEHLCRSGLAAINQAEPGEPALEEFDSIQTLLTRSVILWLVVTALLQLI